MHKKTGNIAIILPTMKNYIHISVFTVTLLSMCSCGTADRRPVILHAECRDRHVDAADMTVPVGGNMPELHSFSAMILAGDTLLTYDAHAGLQFTAYDLHADTVIGRFGKSGNDPGEIAHLQPIFYNRHSKTLYGANVNRDKISSFYLPWAVGNPDYNALDNFRIDIFKCPVADPYFLNDSTVLCTVHIPKETPEYQLAVWNPVNNRVTALKSDSYYDGAHFEIDVAPEKNMIFAADTRQDVISIYSLDGRLQRRIFGPEYDGDTSGRNRFYSTPVICGDKVAMLYSGPHGDPGSHAAYDKIILTDLDGGYITTLDFGFPVSDIIYHAGTNRLYMTVDAKPQLRYLPLDSL